MIMDALDTLSQLALAHADQLAILESVQNCGSNQQSADQDLLCIPDEDILTTPEELDTQDTMPEHMASNFMFHSTSIMTNSQSCRQQKQMGEYICICQKFSSAYDVEHCLVQANIETKDIVQLCLHLHSL